MNSVVLRDDQVLGRKTERYRDQYIEGVEAGEILVLHYVPYVSMVAKLAFILSLPPSL